LYIWSPGLPITRGSPGSTVPSGSATSSSGGFKNTPRPPGIRLSEGGGSLRRASGGDGFLMRASGGDPEGQWGGAPRRATGGDAPPGSSDGEAPKAGRQSPTALPNRTSGGAL
jgi:hypothetical protein